MKIDEFDEMASNIFGKVYPLIARQAIERTEINEGLCIDIGSGGGHLGLSIAEITNMKVYLLDKSNDAKNIANEKIQERSLKGRVAAIEGDVHNIKLDGNSIDLAISRASYHSWDDKVKALKEIYRVLKFGGKTYIGGGYGSDDLKEEVENKMIERKVKGWFKDKKKKSHEDLRIEISEILNQAKIQNFQLITDQSGYWLIISK